MCLITCLVQKLPLLRRRIPSHRYRVIVTHRDARDRERLLAEAYAEAVNESDPEVKRRKLAELQQGTAALADISVPIHHGAAGTAGKTVLAFLPDDV